MAKPKSAGLRDLAVETEFLPSTVLRPLAVLTVARYLARDPESMKSRRSLKSLESETMEEGDLDNTTAAYPRVATVMEAGSETVILLF
jgi:DNA-binding IclR family transcriptional regulator